MAILHWTAGGGGPGPGRDLNVRTIHRPAYGVAGIAHAEVHQRCPDFDRERACCLEGSVILRPGAAIESEQICSPTPGVNVIGNRPLDDASTGDSNCECGTGDV